MNLSKMNSAKVKTGLNKNLEWPVEVKLKVIHISLWERNGSRSICSIHIFKHHETQTGSHVHR
jgi:hypothetical protein